MKKTIAILLSFLICLSLTSALAQTAPVQIGIAQFADHPSLDNCREGFIQGLKDAGYEDGVNITLHIQNAQADMGLAAIIASSFVDSHYGLICAIATPMAVTCVNTADGEIPVVYSAVSAPIEAGLSNADGLYDGNATGTSDQISVRNQLALIRAFQPEAKTIGLLYTVGEINSKVQAAQYRAAAAEYGFTIVEATITSGADIALALPSLLQKADCLSMLTDNTVVQFLDVVLDQADAKMLPVYGSEIEQVKNGCVATVGIDYLALGRQTGQIAARILNGESANDIPFETIKESALYMNSQAVLRLSLTVPAELQGVLTDVAP